MQLRTKTVRVLDLPASSTEGAQLARRELSFAASGLGVLEARGKLAENPKSRKLQQELAAARALARLANATVQVPARAKE